MKLAATDAAKAVQMLDLLGEFFADGSRWIRGEFHDDDGNRCLVGAMRHIRAVRSLYGDPTRYYLQKAMAEEAEGLVAFNDGCRDFTELRGLMLTARGLAVADIAAQPALAASDRLAA
ncbi:MAG: hypothetical protein WA184_11790 [Stellaceae bacterium]